MGERGERRDSEAGSILGEPKRSLILVHELRAAFFLRAARAASRSSLCSRASGCRHLSQMIGRRPPGISVATSILAIIYSTLFQAKDPNSMLQRSGADWVWESVFLGPLVVLCLSKSRKVDLAALGGFILQYVVAAFV